MKSIAGENFLSTFGYDVCYSNVPDSSCEKWIELKPMDLTQLRDTGASGQQQGQFEGSGGSSSSSSSSSDPSQPDDDNNNTVNSNLNDDDAHRLSRYSEDGRLVVNSPFTLRAEEDEFGRKITFLRKGLTNNDSEPFETL